MHDSMRASTCTNDIPSNGGLFRNTPIAKPVLLNDFQWKITYRHKVHNLALGDTGNGPLKLHIISQVEIRSHDHASMFTAVIEFSTFLLPLQPFPRYVLVFNLDLKHGHFKLYRR